MVYACLKLRFNGRDREQTGKHKHMITSNHVGKKIIVKMAWGGRKE